MTTETAIAEARDLIEQLAAMTVACPECDRCCCVKPMGEGCGHGCFDGQRPRFPSARRKCEARDWVSSTGRGGIHPSWCDTCNGTGEVPDYDVFIEALEAGLTPQQALDAQAVWTGKLIAWVASKRPMPSEAVIREAKLRAIIAVVGVEV